MTSIFEKQWLHFGFVALTLVVTERISYLPAVGAGQLWGIGSVGWLWIAVLIAVAHQVFVWFCWRMQLHGKLLTRTMGSAGFEGYAALFFFLFVARILAVWVLAIANQGSIEPWSLPRRALALVLAAPALYLFYSVGRYFGFRRAVGIDHFDEAYRSRPRVRQGIFRFTSNGMYVFGFFVFWIPALWWGSAAAFYAALFNHLYIWVHYYSTELPDMRRIYDRP